MLQYNGSQDVLHIAEQGRWPAGSVQQPATPSPPAAVSLPLGATPLDPPGTEALPQAAGLPLGAVPTAAPPHTAAQPSSWAQAGSSPVAPRPLLRPLPRLMPRPPPVPPPVADSFAGVADGRVLYQGQFANGYLPHHQGPDGAPSASGDLVSITVSQANPGTVLALSSAPANWFAQHNAHGQPMPGTLITPGYPGVRRTDSMAHRDQWVPRHVIRAGPSTGAPQRHVLTPRVARPTGLVALEKLLRPSRAAEFEAEQVRNIRRLKASWFDELTSTWLCTRSTIRVNFTWRINVILAITWTHDLAGRVCII